MHEHNIGLSNLVWVLILLSCSRFKFSRTINRNKEPNSNSNLCLSRPQASSRPPCPASPSSVASGANGPYPSGTETRKPIPIPYCTDTREKALTSTSSYASTNRRTRPWLKSVNGPWKRFRRSSSESERLKARKSGK